MQKSLFAILIAALVLTACKKNSDSNDPVTASDGFVPAPGLYNYVFTSTDGTNGSENVGISPKRDTAAGHAVTMIATIQNFHDTTTIYSDGKQTITPINAIKEFDSIANVIRHQPGVTEFSYGGWPVIQLMPNTAAVDDNLSFSGGPVHLHWVIQDNNTSVTGDFKLSYEDGKVLATGVPVKTAAGTYTCSVWAYTRKSEIQAGPISRVQVYNDTLYMSPGIPFVKSTEFTNGVYTVTQLNKIN